MSTSTTSSLTGVAIDKPVIPPKKKWPLIPKGEGADFLLRFLHWQLAVSTVLVLHCSNHSKDLIIWIRGGGTFYFTGFLWAAVVSLISLVALVFFVVSLFCEVPPIHAQWYYLSAAWFLFLFSFMGLVYNAEVVYVWGGDCGKGTCLYTSQGFRAVAYVISSMHITTYLISLYRAHLKAGAWIKDRKPKTKMEEASVQTSQMNVAVEVEVDGEGEGDKGKDGTKDK